MNRRDGLPDDLKSLYDNLRQLNDHLNQFTSTNYKRVNPFFENIVDWHEKADKYFNDSTKIRLIEAIQISAITCIPVYSSTFQIHDFYFRSVFSNQGATRIKFELWRIPTNEVTLIFDHDMNIGDGDFSYVLANAFLSGFEKSKIRDLTRKLGQTRD